MGPPKFGAPGNCPICPPPLKPALTTTTTTQARSHGGPCWGNAPLRLGIPIGP